MRPTRIQWFMELAQATAKRSTCCRLNVGAVVVVNRNPVSFGYNGRKAGKPHCEGNACPGRFLCQETVHAEMNAINRMPTGLGTVPPDLFTTDSPCILCCSAIFTRGIGRVFFSNPYRLTDHLFDLNKQGVSIFRVLPAGYVMDWITKEIVEFDV